MALCVTLARMAYLRGQALVAAVVRDEIDRQNTSQAKIARLTGIARSHLTRVTNPEESPLVTETTLRRVEGAMNLPRRFLSYVRDGDEVAVRSSGADADLIRSVIHLAGWEAEDRPAPSRTTG